MDPEVMFERAFGRLGPLASNISHLLTKLTKHLLFASFDETAHEFIHLQNNPKFVTSNAINWLVE